MDPIPTDAIQRGTSHSRRYVFAEEGATGLRPEPDLLAMTRSHTHKLIYFQGSRTGQLLDLAEDPGETRNRWDDEAYRSVRPELTAELLDWLYTNRYQHRELNLDWRQCAVPDAGARSPLTEATRQCWSIGMEGGETFS